MQLGASRWFGMMATMAMVMCNKDVYVEETLCGEEGSERKRKGERDETLRQAMMTQSLKRERTVNSLLDWGAMTTESEG